MPLPDLAKSPYELFFRRPPTKMLLMTAMTATESPAVDFSTTSTLSSTSTSITSASADTTTTLALIPPQAVLEGERQEVPEIEMLLPTPMLEPSELTPEMPAIDQPANAK